MVASDEQGRGTGTTNVPLDSCSLLTLHTIAQNGRGYDAYDLVSC